MYSKDKVIENFCLIDDFCKELNKTIDEHSIEDGLSTKKTQQKVSNVSKRDNNHYASISFKRLSLFKALLHKSRMQIHEKRISIHGIIQQVCRTTTKIYCFYGAFSSDALLGYVFWDFIYGFYFD